MRSTIDLAANLGLSVVAEGVEDAETLAELTRLGCDAAQGYFISRPVPAGELAAWLADVSASSPPAWTARPRRLAVRVILIVAGLVCVATVPLTGGQLRRVAQLRFRWASAAVAALALQVAITTLAPSGSTRLHELLHLACYALAAGCIVANRRIAGLPVLALGAALNDTTIAVNDGVMPASARAMRRAGLEPAEHFANSAAVAEPRLLALGDVIPIPIPGPWP